MNECISRKETIKELREVYENEYPTASGDFDEYASHDVPNVLRNMPTADVQPVKRGKWVYYKNNGIWDIHKCTVCNTPFELPMDVVPSSVFCYCPNCGADMRETKEGLKMKTQTYVKVKPSCDNCVHQCGVQLMSKESPRWYCNKHGYNKEELPEERTCSDFEFDTSIVKPSVDSHDVLFKMDDE